MAEEPEWGVDSDTGPFAIVPRWLYLGAVSDRAVRLYTVLAGRADRDDGTCFPSRSLLAAELRCHPRTVDRARVELVELGAVKAEQRWLPAKPGGEPEQTTTRYTVHRVPPARVSRPLGDSANTPRHTRQGELEPGELEPVNKVKHSDASQGFDRFWQTYPKRVGKAAARRAWDKAVRDVDWPVIVEGARRFAGEVTEKGTEPRYVPHPATWLNAGRWDDEPDAAIIRMPRGADATRRAVERAKGRQRGD